LAVPLTHWVVGRTRFGLRLRAIGSGRSVGIGERLIAMTRQFMFRFRLLAALTLAIGSLMTIDASLPEAQLPPIADDTDVRDYQSLIDLVGASGKINGEELAERLVVRGIPASESKTAISELLKTPDINPAAIPVVADLACRLGTMANESFLLVTLQLKDALTGGIEPLIAFASRYDLLTGEQISAARETLLHRSTGQAIQDIFVAMNAKVPRGLSPPRSLH
jgi:hypothetical protein